MATFACVNLEDVLLRLNGVAQFKVAIDTKPFYLITALKLFDYKCIPAHNIFQPTH